MSLNPVDLIKQAVKELPALKPIWAVVAAIAILAIIKALDIDYKTALIGVPIVFLLIIVFSVFATTYTHDVNDKSKKLASLLIWSMVAIFIISVLLISTSLFFNYPVNISKLYSTKLINEHSIIKEPKDVDSYTNSLLPSDIYLEISENTPSAQFEEKAKNYVGLKVKWNLELMGIGEKIIQNNIQYYVLWTSQSPLPYNALGSVSIVFFASDKEYSYLKIMKKGAKLKVYGTIAAIQWRTIYLDDAKMTLVNPKSDLK